MDREVNGQTFQGSPGRSRNFRGGWISASKEVAVTQQESRSDRAQVSRNVRSTPIVFAIQPRKQLYLSLSRSSCAALRNTVLRRAFDAVRRRGPSPTTLAAFFTPGHLTTTRLVNDSYRFLAPTEINTSRGAASCIDTDTDLQSRDVPLRLVREMFFSQSDLISTSRVQRLAAASGGERKREVEERMERKNESVSCDGILTFPGGGWKRGCTTVKSFDPQPRQEKPISRLSRSRYFQGRIDAPSR